MPDRDVRHLQVRGFARLRGEVLGRRAEDRDALAASSSGEVITSARGGSAVTAWVLAIAFLVLGSRAWLTDTIPVVGEFVRFPGDPATLFEAWTSRYREVGVGTVGPSPTANGALAAASALTLGSTSLLRQILILATLPVGAIGMWRLCRPVGSRRPGGRSVRLPGDAGAGQRHGVGPLGGARGLRPGAVDHRHPRPGVAGGPVRCPGRRAGPACRTVRWGTTSSGSAS
ncbi:MAG: hypothetical protein R2690_13665 [Acidimicrobiales bacterium]